VYVEAGQPFEAVYAHGDSGLVPGIEVAIFDGDGNIAFGPTGADIAEEMVGITPLGVYTWNAPAAPLITGQYTIIWSPDGSWDAITNSTADELVVVAIGIDTLPPLPAPVGGGVGPGPCTAWTTSLAIAQCQGVVNSNVYDDAIQAASEILYELSARRFPGTCERTVRPCQTSGAFCGIQILSRGYVVFPYAWTGMNWGFDCGCSPLSYVELVGKPVTAITEVEIDGVVLAPTEYRLDSQQYLVRLNGEFWPACQRLDLDTGEPGTWSVTYQHGQAIPMAAQMAARDLAWEIYKSCASTDGDADCELPEGVTRVTRQGITYELPAFVSWGRDFNGNWHTGITSVDAFLTAYNPRGLQRRPILYVPGAQKQARKVGY
jgi:hypothetical protein